MHSVSVKHGIFSPIRVIFFLLFFSLSFFSLIRVILFRLFSLAPSSISNKVVIPFYIYAIFCSNFMCYSGSVIYVIVFCFTYSRTDGLKEEEVDLEALRDLLPKH